jgi:ABC-type polysaccharide/polyol phosphate transport system ATPase subunit
MIDDLTLEDNVYLYGAIYGLEREAIREKFNEIVEWAELNTFVGAELRMLSSGMRARLAFSTIRHVEADIFLFDEALTAGDKSFKEKCDEVLEKYKGSDRTFVIATHDVEFAKKFCSKTLWLAKGEQMAFGETEEVVEKYLAGRKP